MRRRVTILVAGLVAALGVGLTGSVAGGASTTYTALGDSYASGVGTRSYIEGSGDCYRSNYAYPTIDAARIGAALTFAACSGATTTSVRNTQLGSLGPDTDYVSVTAGGNDAGFVEVITECATPWWAGDCHGAIDQAQRFITSTLPGRLDTLYSEIDLRASGATVVVVGYPRLFMGEDCNAGTWFSPSEQRRLNETADLLSSVIGDRAAAWGFSYVDPRSAYVGHAVCDDVEWINGLSNPIRESYHPNRLGQGAYANLVDDHLGG